MNKRVVSIFFALCLCVGILSLRLLEIGDSVVSGSSTKNNTKTINLSTLRGTIYDCNMETLVNDSSKTFAASKPGTLALDSLKGILSPEVFDSVSVQMSKGHPVAVEIGDEEIDCKDIKVVRARQRYSPGQLASHLIGYLGSDGTGVSGLEKGYNDLLSAGSGNFSVAFPADATGKILMGGAIETRSSLNNTIGGIALTIDKRIQKITEDAMDELGMKTGAAVVIEIETGAIRAMASRPAFDPNNIAESLGDADSPFINRALLGYAVGSVFKPVISASALENGINQSYTYECTGKIEINGISFGCHDEKGHGVLNMISALSVSCNPYFISLAEKLNAESIVSQASAFGFGTKIDFANGISSASGYLPAISELDSPAAIANLSFGQSTLLATPVQMAAYMAAIASNGNHIKPHLILGEVDSSGLIKNKTEPNAPERVLSEQTSKILQKQLINCVSDGGGRNAQPNSGGAAGKTATAQTGKFVGSGELTHGWFAGWFPAESPKYAVAVFNENAGSGSHSCAPIFKQIADNIMAAGH